MKKYKSKIKKRSVCDGYLRPPFPFGVLPLGRGIVFLNFVLSFYILHFTFNI